MCCRWVCVCRSCLCRYHDDGAGGVGVDSGVGDGVDVGDDDVDGVMVLMLLGMLFIVSGVGGVAVVGVTVYNGVGCVYDVEICVAVGGVVVTVYGVAGGGVAVGGVDDVGYVGVAIVRVCCWLFGCRCC